MLTTSSRTVGVDEVLSLVQLKHHRKPNIATVTGVADRLLRKPWRMPPDHIPRPAAADLDPQLTDDEVEHGDNFVEDDPLDAVPMDPIEEAIALHLGTRELLHRTKCALARMVALLEWIRENPEVYSFSRALDISRAIGRRQRALMTLVSIALAEQRDGPEPDPPQELVDRLVGMLRDEVLGVLREVTDPDTAARFESRLLEKMAE